jgi:hypothetical protein
MTPALADSAVLLDVPGWFRRALRVYLRVIEVGRVRIESQVVGVVGVLRGVRSLVGGYVVAARMAWV